MKNLFARIIAVVFVVSLSTGFAFAADKKADKAPAKAAEKTAEKKDDKKAADSAGLVDINTASKKELMAIPGVGEAYSAKIIAGRPYKNKTQLKTKGNIPSNVYEKIKDKVVAKQ
jgi:DNA uptake protein ComE-like DNA-binding protein